MIIEVDFPLSAGSPRWPWSTPYEPPTQQPKSKAKAAKKQKAPEVPSIRFEKFLDLPDECLVLILSYLNESDLFNLDWAYTLKDPSALPLGTDWLTFQTETVLFMEDKHSTIFINYKTFVQLNSKVDPVSEKIRRLISKLPLWNKRQCLTFSNSYHPDRVHWQFTLRNAGPYIQTVELRDLNDQSNTDDFHLLFKWINVYCPNVKDISLAEEQHKCVCDEGIAGNDVANCLLSIPAPLKWRLEYLTLTFCQEREQSFSFALVGGFPNLKSLSIRHLCCFDDKALMDLAKIFKKHNKNILKFSCHYSAVTNDSIQQFLESQPKIDEICLTDCEVDFPLLGERLRPIMEGRSSEIRVLVYHKMFDPSPRPISSQFVKFVELNEKPCPVCPYLQDKEDISEMCQSFSCTRKLAQLFRWNLGDDADMDDDDDDDDDSMDDDDDDDDSMDDDDDDPMDDDNLLSPFAFLQSLKFKPSFDNIAFLQQWKFNPNLGSNATQPENRSRRPDGDNEDGSMDDDADHMNDDTNLPANIAPQPENRSRRHDDDNEDERMVGRWRSASI